MQKFLLKILFLIETLVGVELFIVAIFTPIPIMGVNVLLIILGIILIFDGLERLDGKEHGPY